MVSMLVYMMDPFDGPPIAPSDKEAVYKTLHSLVNRKRVICDAYMQSPDEDYKLRIQAAAVNAGDEREGGLRGLLLHFLNADNGARQAAAVARAGEERGLRPMVVLLYLLASRSPVVWVLIILYHRHFR